MTPTPEQPRLPNLPSTSRSDEAMGRETKEPLQVRIPISVKRRFKAHAAMQGMEPNQLFVEVWEFYEQGRAATAATREGEA